MKRHISIICATSMLLGVLCGCGQNGTVAQADSVAQNVLEASQAKDSEGGEKLSIVTTIFPEYDWTLEILGEKAQNAEVTMLLDNGVDLHSYQPTAEDIMKISSCDLFIYVGGESDEWVDDALKEATNENMIVIDLLDTLKDVVKEEEVVEGMEAEDEHDHADEAKDTEKRDDEARDAEGHDSEANEKGHDHEEGEAEYDEHVWLSLKNAGSICKAIEEALSKLDPDNGDSYRANLDAYVEKLENLNSRYEEMVTTASCRTLLFGDRFPFRYLVDDYDLDYYAAFVGCSAETEASFETITFLSAKIDELSLSSIMVIESSDQKIAETIRSNTKTKDQEILVLDSMQATTMNDAENGASYLSIMENNLEVLKQALN